MGAHTLRNNSLIFLFCLSFSFSFAQNKKSKSGKNKSEVGVSAKELLLPSIIIHSPNRKYKISGDTISYPVSSYLKLGIKKAEDLFRQLEGFKVDDRGKIFFNGKEVRRLLVDGQDLVGDQYRILSKNIQAGLIETVQVQTHYNQNPILRDFETTDEIAVDLIIREDKKNKLNGSIETGFGMLNKYNVDADAVGLFKKFKSVAFLDKNNIGANSSNDEFSSNNGITDYVTEDMYENLSSPFEITVNSLPNIPQSYTNDNSDHDLNLIGSFKAGNFKTIKIASSISRLKKENTGIKNMQYSFPAGELWSRRDVYRIFEKQGIEDFKLSYKKDNKLNVISNYELSGLRLRKGGGYLNKRNGVIDDSLNEHSKSEVKLFSFKGNETIKLRKGFMLYAEIMYALSNNVSDLNTFYSIPIFSPLLEMADMQQVYNSITKIKNLKSSIYKNAGKFYTRFGFQINETEKKTGSELYRKNQFVTDSKMNLYVNSSIWKTMGSIGYKGLKKIFMQVDFAIGEGLIQIKGNELQPKTTFNLNYQLDHHKGPFNRWSSEISVARKMPPIVHFFPSPLLAHNSTILFGLLNPSFPLIKNFEINYQRSDFYRAIQLSGNIAGSWIDNDNSTSLFNYPDYIIKSFFISNKSIQLRSNFHLEKYFNKIKLKTIFESNVFYTKSPERINDFDTSQSILSNEFKTTIISNWKWFLNLESGCSLSNSSVFGSRYDYTSKKQLSLFRNFLKFKATLGKNTVASFLLSSETYNNLNIFYAGNGSIDWRLGKSIQSSIMIHNLFNNTRYFESQKGLYGSISRAYLLQKRYFLLSLQLSF